MEKVSLKIFRFTPSKDASPVFQTYAVPVVKGMTVLDSLLYVKEHLDHSVTFRHSCRMGNCGSCGMIINGSPRLACQTPITDLKSGEVEVKPLENLPLVRDLVCDFTEFYDKHRQAKPYIIRGDRVEETAAAECIQSREETHRYLQFALCVKCGLCFHACPITSSDTGYLGPQALSQAYRYLADSRDDDNSGRIEGVDSRNGCWGCHLAGSCSVACPKGVDPALGIQLLKRLVISSRLRGSSRGK